MTKYYIFVIIICIIFISIRFKKTSNNAKKRFSTYSAKSNIIKTSFGKMSYIDEGIGEAIISFHGICGGYDQAYDTLADKTDEYRIIAPSRFGYPGTDMPLNATIEMQATAYKELMDTLKIDKAYILSTSAGATSAIKFALMYPHRTKGLILYCSGYPRLEAPKKALKFAGPPSIMCSDIAMWLVSPLFKPIMGMNRSAINTIMPMKDRKKGIIFDGMITNTDMVNNYQEYDMSKLEIPVLMIHSKDDKLANFNTVEPWKNKIKECTCVFFESGGHLMMDNSKRINESLHQFIDRTK